MAAGIRLGIDLGTSNTVAVLRWPDGRCRPLLFDGSPQLPSAVYAGPDGFLVGRDAVNNSRVHPDRFERNPKRRVDDGSVLLGDVELPVVDLMAAVLRQVRAEAVRVAGASIAEVVLTHPVDWGPRRRAMLAHACGRAGLGSPRLVPEPVAAASYFVAVLRNELAVGRCLVVYDFGAGTFDATVVRRTGASLEVLATDGVADAGGLDVDAAIVAYLGEVLSSRDPAGWQRLTSPRTSADRRSSQQLWDDVRGAKETLSRAPSAVLHVPVIDTDAPIGREQLERFARPVLDRTVAATQSALRAAAVAPDSVAGIFLVGGSSRIPLVATLLHRTLHVAPTTLEQPEIVVAEGSLFAPPAALAAADLRRYTPPPVNRLPAARPTMAPAAPRPAAPGPPPVPPRAPARAPAAAPAPAPASTPKARPVRAVAKVASARLTTPPAPPPPQAIPLAPTRAFPAVPETAVPPSAPAPGGGRLAGGALPLLIALPAGAGHTLASTPDGTEFLAEAGQLLLFRDADRLAAFLGRRSFAGVTAAARWNELPTGLRPDDLRPDPDGRYDYARLGRILAGACPADSLPMHRSAAGRFTPVEPDRTGAAEPADLTRHVDLARRVFTALGRRSTLLDPDRVDRSAGPVIAAIGTGRLDATTLTGAAEPQQRFRAAAWWWQLVDELAIATTWR